MKKNREWWYRSVEEPAEVELAMRFALSQNPVVAGIPPSFLDLLDKTIEAAKAFKPLDETAITRLKEMAANQGSNFKREEDSVAMNPLHWVPVYPDSPHECGYGHMASALEKPLEIHWARDPPQRFAKRAARQNHAVLKSGSLTVTRVPSPGLLSS